MNDVPTQYEYHVCAQNRLTAATARTRPTATVTATDADGAGQARNRRDDDQDERMLSQPRPGSKHASGDHYPLTGSELSEITRTSWPAGRR